MGRGSLRYGGKYQYCQHLRLTQPPTVRHSSHLTHDTGKRQIGNESALYLALRLHQGTAIEIKKKTDLRLISELDDDFAGESMVIDDDFGDGGGAMKLITGGLQLYDG